MHHFFTAEGFVLFLFFVFSEQGKSELFYSGKVLNKLSFKHIC